MNITSYLMIILPALLVGYVCFSNRNYLPVAMRPFLMVACLFPLGRIFAGLAAVAVISGYLITNYIFKADEDVSESTKSSSTEEQITPRSEYDVQ